MECDLITQIIIHIMLSKLAYQFALEAHIHIALG